MICPIKLSIPNARKFMECEKEKCAWWVEVNKNSSGGTLIKLGCAIKLIAEK